MYRVKYSTVNHSDPPSEALEVVTPYTSAILTNGIQEGTTYYVWVCAISNKLHGKYSRRAMNTTFQGNYQYSSFYSCSKSIIMEDLCPVSLFNIMLAIEHNPGFHTL